MMKKLSDKEDEFCKMVVWESLLPARLMRLCGIPVMMRARAQERAAR